VSDLARLRVVEQLVGELGEVCAALSALEQQVGGSERTTEIVTLVASAAAVISPLAGQPSAVSMETVTRAWTVLSDAHDAVAGAWRGSLPRAVASSVARLQITEDRARRARRRCDRLRRWYDRRLTRRPD
jgi:hypothetical protein